MTPSELAELKIHLQELQDKGFYPTKYITVGLSSLVREKERSWVKIMCGLSTLEYSYHQK